MALSGVDKLQAVAKIMVDLRLEELIRENQALKLSNFWKDHNIHQLKSAMEYANIKFDGPECTCNVCAICGRKPEDLETTGTKCEFKPWFDLLLKKHGFTTCLGGLGSYVYHESSSNGVEDLDVHFVMIGRDDWFKFEYGAKIWKAKHVNDPVLVKLVAFFDELRESYDSD